MNDNSNMNNNTNPQNTDLDSLLRDFQSLSGSTVGSNAQATSSSTTPQYGTPSVSSQQSVQPTVNQNSINQGYNSTSMNSNPYGQVNYSQQPTSPVNVNNGSNLNSSPVTESSTINQPNINPTPMNYGGQINNNSFFGTASSPYQQSNNPVNNVSSPGMPQSQINMPKPSVSTIEPSKGMITSNSSNGGDTNGFQPIDNDYEIDDDDAKAKKNLKKNLPVIIGIVAIIALFIFFMPKVGSLFNGKSKSKTKKTAAAADKVTKPKESTLVCNEADRKLSDIQTMKTTYNIYYLDNKVTKVVKVVKFVFPDKDGIESEYQYVNAQNVCNAIPTKYANITGYKSTCKEEKRIFTVEHIYDLEDFVNPTQIMIDGKTETIESVANYDDEIGTVKANLETKGVTCK